MIALDLQPLNLIENLGFQDILKFFCPELDGEIWKLPSEDYTTKRLNCIYEDAICNMRQELELVEWVSLTIDGWTSRATQSFVCITAHCLQPDFTCVSHTLCVEGKFLLLTRSVRGF
jgi:hypothetical protein